MVHRKLKLFNDLRVRVHFFLNVTKLVQNCFSKLLNLHFIVYTHVNFVYLKQNKSYTQKLYDSEARNIKSKFKSIHLIHWPQTFTAEDIYRFL